MFRNAHHLLLLIPLVLPLLLLSLLSLPPIIVRLKVGHKAIAHRIGQIELHLVRRVAAPPALGRRVLFREAVIRLSE